jgi:hypothetical protein
MSDQLIERIHKLETHFELTSEKLDNGFKGVDKDIQALKIDLPREILQSMKIKWSEIDERKRQELEQDKKDKRNMLIAIFGSSLFIFVLILSTFYHDHEEIKSNKQQSQETLLIAQRAEKKSDQALSTSKSTNDKLDVALFYTKKH